MIKQLRVTLMLSLALVMVVEKMQAAVASHNASHNAPHSASSIPTSPQRPSRPAPTPPQLPSRPAPQPPVRPATVQSGSPATMQEKTDTTLKRQNSVLEFKQQSGGEQGFEQADKVSKAISDVAIENSKYNTVDQALNDVKQLTNALDTLKNKSLLSRKTNLEPADWNAIQDKIDIISKNIEGLKIGDKSKAVFAVSKLQKLLGEKVVKREERSRVDARTIVAARNKKLGITLASGLLPKQKVYVSKKGIVDPAVLSDFKAIDSSIDKVLQNRSEQDVKKMQAYLNKQILELENYIEKDFRILPEKPANPTSFGIKTTAQKNYEAYMQARIILENYRRANDNLNTNETSPYPKLPLTLVDGKGYRNVSDIYKDAEVLSKGVADDSENSLGIALKESINEKAERLFKDQPVTSKNSYSSAAELGNDVNALQKLIKVEDKNIGGTVINVKTLESIIQNIRNRDDNTANSIIKKSVSNKNSGILEKVAEAFPKLKSDEQQEVTV